MQKITIYPHIAYSTSYKEAAHPNPYIDDFVSALVRSESVASINAPSKNPLLSILPLSKWGDITIFNWFENIPNYKHGLLQTLAAFVYVAALRITGRKVVYILHNKKVHSHRYEKVSQWLMSYIIRYSHLIVTHSQEGISFLKANYPSAVKKAHFLHHPTKNRLSNNEKEKKYDLIIWGGIQRYKGVLEFLEFLQAQQAFHPSICIVGRCSDKQLEGEIRQLCTDHITLIPQSLPFEEIGEWIRMSHFVLIPYNPETILSSGVLMDSLSFGAKVIGPDAGSFKDYASSPLLCVYSYKTLADLPHLFQKHLQDEVVLTAYEKFLNDNSWDQFVERILQLIH